MPGRSRGETAPERYRTRGAGGGAATDACKRSGPPGLTALAARFLNPTAAHVRRSAPASETTKRDMAFSADGRFGDVPDPGLGGLCSPKNGEVKATDGIRLTKGGVVGW